MEVPLVDQRYLNMIPPESLGGVEPAESASEYYNAMRHPALLDAAHAGDVCDFDDM